MIAGRCKYPSEGNLSMGIQNAWGRVLPRGGIGTTGVGQRSGSAVVIIEPLKSQVLRCRGTGGDGRESIRTAVERHGGLNYNHIESLQQK